VFLRGDIKLMGSLKYLNLQGNYLTWLHPDVTCLYRLEYLNLSDNDLIHIPQDFNRLTKLKGILQVAMCKDSLSIFQSMVFIF